MAHNKKGTPGYYEWLRKVRATRESERKLLMEEAKYMLKYPEGSYD